MSDDLMLGTHSIDSEHAALGAMMFDENALDWGAMNLSPEDFFTVAGRTVYAALQFLHGQGREANLITISERLREAGELAHVGDVAFLGGLMEAAPTASAMPHYGAILQQYTLKRRLVALATEAIRRASEAGPDEIAGLVEDVKVRFDALGMPGKAEETLHRLGEVVAASWEATCLRAKDPVGDGLPTGIESLDRITTGWRNETLIILGAWQSEGKSTALLNWLCHLSCFISQPIPTLLFSLEMDHQALAGKILSAQGDIDHRRLRQPRFMEEADFVRLTETCSRLYDKPLFIDDASGLTMQQIALRAKRYVRKHGIRLVAVDFLQHLAMPKGIESTRHGYIAACIAAKNLAKELRLPVIVASQLTRKDKQQSQTRRPRKDDLAESSALETYADQIVLIWHPDGTTHDGMKEFIVDKNRLGQKGDARIYWDGDHQRFRDIDTWEVQRFEAERARRREEKGKHGGATAFDD